MSDPLATVQAALAAVMVDVDHVAKTGRNKSQGYNFRGIDAVLQAVGPVMRKHSLIVLPCLDEITESVVNVGKERTPMGHATVIVRYVFIGPDGSTLEARVPGEAMDSGDKAVPKAMSVAMRTALIQALALPTDEPDPDSETFERVGAAPVSNVAESKRRLIDLLDGLGHVDPTAVAAMVWPQAVPIGATNIDDDLWAKVELAAREFGDQPDEGPSEAEDHH